MDRLSEIFKRQREYLATLEPIYRANGDTIHSFPMPWMLDNRKAQEEFRLLAWRMTEEIVEATELHYECVDHYDDYFEKFKEEIADAFHFFVELCLATGTTVEILNQEFISEAYSPDSLTAVFTFCSSGDKWTIPQGWAYVTYKLGIAMHKLRQRPWRTDNRPTNKDQFYASMTATFLTFISACKRSGIDADALYDAYFAKSKINYERAAQQKL
jgi:dUTPase